MRVDNSREPAIGLDELSKPRQHPMDAEPQADVDVVGPASYSSDHAYPPPDYSESLSHVIEHALEPLLPTESRTANDAGWIPRRFRLHVRISVVLAIIFVGLAIFVSVLKSLNCPSDADVAEARRNWAAERESYAQESRQWEAQRQKWQRERHDEERRRKDVEMLRKGVYWTEPVGSAQCDAYSTRRYTATLQDIPADLPWLEVCSDMPVVIHKRKLDRPDKCEKDNGNVIGTWFVNFNEPSCVPYWDTISDKGCAPGKAGTRRLQGRLWGLRQGDDWEKMCATTPASFKGVSFENPISCEDKGNLFGVIGSWDYPDEDC